MSRDTAWLVGYRQRPLTLRRRGAHESHFHAIALGFPHTWGHNQSEEDQVGAPGWDFGTRPTRRRRFGSALPFGRDAHEGAIDVSNGGRPHKPHGPVVVLAEQGEHSVNAGSTACG